MPLWLWFVDAIGAILLLVLAYGAVLVFRRRWIARAGGTFELSHRDASARPGRGWVLGVGRYSGECLEFFRVFSVVPRPMSTWSRRDLVYAGHREPVGAEAHALYTGHVVVGCSSSKGDLELAMAPEAVTGFLAWLEAAPPGTRPLPH